MATDKVQAPKLPLTLPEYRRIYEVIYSVLNGKVNTAYACTHFAMAGALILSEHYKIAARPVASAFLLCDDPSLSLICFGKIEGGRITSDANGFHAWVQTHTHVIDFMAPIFNESAKGKGYSQTIPRKMFQRPLSEEANSSDQLRESGNYLTIPNIELTNEVASAFMGLPSALDLLATANRWLKKQPKKLAGLSLQDELGKLHKLNLSAPPVTGAW